jgi:hypothetical protein
MIVQFDTCGRAADRVRTDTPKFQSRGNTNNTRAQNETAVSVQQLQLIDYKEPA